MAYFIVQHELEQECRTETIAAPDNAVRKEITGPTAEKALTNIFGES